MGSTDTGASLGPAAVRAIGAAVLGAGIWIGLAGPFGVTTGLPAVAIFVGWLVGSATRSAPSGNVTNGMSARTRLRAIAVGGAVFAWLLALTGVWLYSLATLPSLGPAGSTFGERIAATPITSFYAQQFGALDVVDALAIVLAAWWTAR